jgi:hypothetical protein
MSHNERLAQRLADGVSAKLGTPVEFARWERDSKTGADVPVFRVPAGLMAQAKSLGLTVESEQPCPRT